MFNGRATQFESVALWAEIWFACSPVAHATGRNMPASGLRATSTGTDHQGDNTGIGDQKCVGVTCLCRLDAEHTVERVGGLVDQCFGEVLVGMEVLEREVSVIADAVKGFEDGGPIGRSVQERPKGFE